jgi:hypothetical protein
VPPIRHNYKLLYYITHMLYKELRKRLGGVVRKEEGSKEGLSRMRSEQRGKARGEVSRTDGAG